jgi:acetate kinase
MIESLLYKESGLLVSGISTDWRELLESSAPTARFLLERRWEQ